ncbi:MAG: DsbA family protein, partial [Gemmatimonadetes bacterium]|nr:DsbA family protein [Gemmatimonadota bacterium]NIR80990.1 DsbA family protein [Gemmatimonadota bacterium]NIT89522.1 DsbA family protein [Gemmatimonadota bacterium]NIU33603.1 DsbA family protein [Gemmatimonadota bacterium]NIU37856.1 DsbA family protein [Gemmatimonadota bacterium]
MAESSSAGEGTATRIVPVSVYSDYTCPWCYVGLRRLDRLREELPEGLELDVTWRPFEIHPEVPREGMPVEDLGYPE